MESIIPEVLRKFNPILIKASSNNKQPIAKAWTSIDKSDEYEEEVNYAMLTGAKSGLWVFDIDIKDNNVSTTLQWCKDRGFNPIIDTFSVITPSGGYHCYYIYEKFNSIHKFLNNDIKSDGGCVMFIGSKFENGLLKDPEYPNIPYTICNNISPIKAPKILIEACSKQSSDNGTSEINTEEIEDIANIINYQLKSVDRSKLNDREIWLTIASTVKSMGGSWEIFCDISRNLPNHEPCTCKKVFESVTLTFTNPILTLVKSLKKYKCNDMMVNKIHEEIDTNNKMTMYDIELYLKNKIYDNINDAYDDLTIKFKDSIAIFNIKAERYISLIESYSKDNSTKCTGISKYDRFKRNYEHLVIQYEVEYYDKFAKAMMKKIETMKFVKFIESKSLFLYEGYYFEPYHTFESSTNDNSRFKNLFNPMIAKYLGYKNYDISKINPILNHFKEVLANNDEHCYKYILSWLHAIIKKPNKKTEICLIFNGDQGCGKTLPFDMIRKYIFGDNCGHLTDGMASLVDKFNSWMYSNLFILCDEPTVLTDLNRSTYEEKLKLVITSKVRELEKKGVDKILVPNYSNLVITCNHTKGVIIPQGDRRYAIFKCNNKYINNRTYFNELTDCFENRENMDILFSFLYDYDDIVEIKNIPQTDIRKNVQNENTSILEQFLFDENFQHCFKRKDIEDNLLTTDNIYRSYNNWITSNKFPEKYMKNKISFCKEMCKLYGTVIQKKINNINVKVFKFNDDIIPKLGYRDDPTFDDLI